MIRCGIVEENEAMLARFMGGLNREIQTILEYKEYTNITHLFHLSCKAGREVQDRQALARTNFSTCRSSSWAPRASSTSTALASPLGATSSLIQESRHNHHYLPRAHLSGLHRALLLPWHQQGTQVILFVVVVREEDILRENANLTL